MPIHSLNFGLETKTPPEILYWLIYSLNFTQLPNQYSNYSIINVLNNWSCETHMEFKKKKTQSHEIETQRRKKKNLCLTYKEEREKKLQNHRHHGMAPSSFFCICLVVLIRPRPHGPITSFNSHHCYHLLPLLFLLPLSSLDCMFFMPLNTPVKFCINHMIFTI